ncbi:hypothetical protein F975_01387 [Acinetobacter sp. ANC 3789]|nr:hypothetical protein F975_01387 [Acinetobacter sp. ANC 3789]
MNMTVPQKLSQKIKNELKVFCQDHSLDKQQYQHRCEIIDKTLFTD